MSRTFGLTDAAKAQLAKQLLKRRGGALDEQAAEPRKLPLGNPALVEEMRAISVAAAMLKLPNPYFRCHEGIAGAQTRIEGRVYDNFVSYNYLGLNGDPRVVAAAQAAIATYGTSVSASRLVSGERPLHARLEGMLANLHRTESCLAFTSGHATNVTAIGHLIDRNDIILHDALIHNSVLQGAQLSGARRSAFAHNDPEDLDRQLTHMRRLGRRSLVILEGHYSMDGDSPDIARFAAVTRRHDAWLMVDEAHSLGVLGARGHGLAEHCGVDPGIVDIWMGTLSKTLSGCGGYIAASHAIIEYLRYSAPGFVYSVGLSPPLAAAAIACLEIMEAEPERVSRLEANGRLFLRKARDANLDTGLSQGASIVPIVIGSSARTARVAQALFESGINVQPIVYPAVPERSARLRFFLSSMHQTDAIENAVQQTRLALERHNGGISLSALTAELSYSRR